MIGLMNNTKWEEIRLAMLRLGSSSPQFRIKDLGQDEPWRWDGEWYYHFNWGGYESIEWCDIRATSDAQRRVVHELLRTIHVPGIETPEGFRLLG
jgi:hypothetical protein